MPSTKKRINLTISDELLARIVAYKEKSGIDTVTSACTQLIVQRLNSLEENEAMMKAINSMSMEKLNEMALIGLKQIKETGEL